MNSKTTSFYTLGCKLNFSETSTISRDLEEEGYAKIDFELGADIYVINTCSVTDQADKKCRNIVRKALKYNPNAFIVVIGCYAQLKPEEISRIKGVDLVLGAQEKFNISNYLKDTVKKKKAVLLNQPIKNVKTFYPGYSVGDRTRSFFKVQDGCNYFCSFCTIPLARGKSRSGTISQTLDKAKEIGNSEVKEVVLTGINLGDFGHGTKENFYQLINELEELNSISRLPNSLLLSKIFSSLILSILIFFSDKLIIESILFVALGIIGLSNILMFFICSTIVNSTAFILSGSFFLTAQGSESLKYLLASKEKPTTIFIYSFNS